jgi:Lrp/AsnC family leucine-responsive transcriptional regulator
MPSTAPRAWTTPSTRRSTAIEACHSIAGDAAYMLFVRVPTPRHLEELIRDIRAAAQVNTRTTIVLQTFFEHRPIEPADS